MIHSERTNRGGGRRWISISFSTTRQLEMATISTTTCLHPILREPPTRGRQTNDPMCRLHRFQIRLSPYAFGSFRADFIVSRKGFRTADQGKDTDHDHFKEDFRLSLCRLLCRISVIRRSWKELPNMCWRWQERGRMSLSFRRASVSKWKTWRFVSIWRIPCRRCYLMWVFPRRKTQKPRAVTYLDQQ